MPTDARIDESELLRRVQQRIDEAQLPADMPVSISAGYGTGREPCGVCDRQISSGQFLYEVIDAASSARLFFHIGCYGIWRRECAQREA